MDSYINRYAKDAENGQHKNIFKKSSHIKSFSIEMQKYAWIEFALPLFFQLTGSPNWMMIDLSLKIKQEAMHFLLLLAVTIIKQRH